MNSYHELHKLLSEPVKTQFKDWFTGSVLHNRWTVIAETSGTVTMRDSIDGGIRIGSPATSGDDTGIGFNDIDQYDASNLVFITQFRRNTTQVRARAAMNGDDEFSPDDGVQWRDDTADSVKMFGTSNGGTDTNVTSSISINTVMTTYRALLNGAAALGHINGVLEAISTTDLPTVNLEPSLQIKTRTGATQHMDVRFMEAYSP